MTTTTSSDPSMTSPPPPPARPRSRTHFGWLLVLIILAAVVLWYFGALRPKPKIAMVAGESPYFELIISGAREAARQYDCDLTVIRAKGDAQADAIKGIIGKKYDGVAVSPFNPSAEAALLVELAGSTTLVTFDSDTPLSYRLCFVGTDNYFAGRLCGQQVTEAVPGGGEVIITSATLDKENGQRRRQGVIDELVERTIKPDRDMDPVEESQKGPKFNVVATLIDAGSPDLVIDNIVKAVKEHPNVKCIVGLNNFSAPRAVLALEKAGKLDQIKVVGFDADKDTLAGIEAGHIAASILQDQYGCGFHAIRILAENARGDKSGLPLFQRRTLPVEVINKENVVAVRGQIAAGGVQSGEGSTPAPAAPTTSAAAN
jgi:ribose transport system substrate-binding protein